jgi:NAD(P)-dependent dehydrogenase (short-subunit alcohol dehydrogenase family)
LGHRLQINDDKCQELGHYTAESFCFARRHLLGNGIYWSPGLPDDVEAMIAALLSDENRWVNAQRIEVLGGLAI